MTIVPELDMRVRVRRDMDIFGLGRIPAGATGTVVGVHPNAPRFEPIADVQFDQDIECLANWDNELQVFREEDACSEVTLEVLEELRGFV